MNFSQKDGHIRAVVPSVPVPSRRVGFGFEFRAHEAARASNVQRRERSRGRGSSHVFSLSQIAFVNSDGCIDRQPPSQADPAQSLVDADAPGPSSSLKRLTSISSIVSSRGPKPKSTKTARETVHSNSDVGTDVRVIRRRGSDIRDEQDSGDPLSSSDVPSNSVSPSVFLKPSGVDEPPGLKGPSKPVDREVNREVPKSSIKRGRDLASDRPLSEGKKRKKKQQQE